MHAIRPRMLRCKQKGSAREIEVLLTGKSHPQNRLPGRYDTRRGVNQRFMARVRASANALFVGAAAGLGVPPPWGREPR
jgi:hypothetical protein